MARWIKFDRDRNFRHPSRAVTVFKGGYTYYMPEHIAEHVIATGWAVEVEKPVNRDKIARSEKPNG